MNAQAYPLQWPGGRPRHTSSSRKSGHFKHYGNRISVRYALERLQAELDRISARLPVVSTNIEPRLDGLPRSDRGNPADPGVCLYFQMGDSPYAMPCDTYDRAADNIAAIAAHIEAMRRIERHGVATVQEMFAGFTALPPPSSAVERPWREVLQVPPGTRVSERDIDILFRNRAKNAHPDAGGSDAEMAELNQAREQALREIDS